MAARRAREPPESPVCRSAMDQGLFCPTGVGHRGNAAGWGTARPQQGSWGGQRPQGHPPHQVPWGLQQPQPDRGHVAHLAASPNAAALLPVMLRSYLTTAGLARGNPPQLTLGLSRPSGPCCWSTRGCQHASPRHSMRRRFSSAPAPGWDGAATLDGGGASPSCRGGRSPRGAMRRANGRTTHQPQVPDHVALPRLPGQSKERKEAKAGGGRSGQSRRQEPSAEKQRVHQSKETSGR